MELVEVKSKLPDYIREALNIPKFRLINPEKDVSHTEIPTETEKHPNHRGTHKSSFGPY